MADVFISFSDDEKQVALALKDFIVNKLDAISVFVSADHWQIQAGERWLDRIERELRAAKIVLLVMSSESVTQPWINFEAGAAWLNGSAVVPVCFGGLTFRTLPKPYDAFQAIELTDHNQMYALLRAVLTAVRQEIAPVPLFSEDRDVLAVRTVVEAVGAHTSPQAVAPLQSVDDSIISLLSDRGKKFLVEASKTDTGVIQRLDLDQALVIKVNGLNFEALDNGRLRAEMDDALRELEETGLISDSLGKRMLFQLTTKGYRIAEKVAGAA